MTHLLKIRLVLLVALIVCFQGRAGATQAPPVDLQLRQPGDLAVNGQPYRNALRIALPLGGELGAFMVNQQGWTMNWIDPVPVGIQPPGTVVDLEFEVVPNDVSSPIRFSGQWNGLAIGTSVDLSLDGYERATLPRMLTSLPAGILPAFTPPPGWVNEVLPDPDEQPVLPTGSAADKDRNITVRGTLAYLRKADSRYVAAYGTTAKVYDDNGILPAKLLGSAVVDLDGSFQVTFTWKEGFFREDDPDIYVKFVAKNSVAQVKAGILSTGAYHWKTPTRENYTGTNLNVGDLEPADEDDFPALHILANISKAWAWLKRHAYAPTQDVTVFWPEGDHSSYVAWPLDQIRIDKSSQWHEHTHIHEYGHHWMYKFDVDAALLPDYNNGYCDTGSPGHCLWCPENPNDAWDEGVPSWISNLVTSNFGDYGPPVPAQHTYQAESLRRCAQDGSFHSGIDTEGYTLALLHDFVDDGDDNDNDPAITTEWKDEMGRMDGGEILMELADHGIHSATGYIEHLRRRSGNPMSLWETAENNGFTGLDTTRPSGVMTVSSTSHEIGVEKAQTFIHYAISQPSDDFSGVGGYKVLVNAGGPGVP
ncbi:MAG: hypothetical protein Q8N51_15685, partial [Gammaproteobacteria bacterium]|nr:hypothetical protein [Gammaproteobacteria bacterium]